MRESCFASQRSGQKSKRSSARAHLLEHCKVGEVKVDETVKMKQNCEVSWTKFFTRVFLEEPSCYFTTGFLNGFFSAVKNRHVKETRCMAMGDLYCGWEFR